MTETPTSAPLTPDDIAFAVERVVSQVEGRWVEKGILSASDDVVAAHIAKIRAGIGGYCTHGIYISWNARGVSVEREGREGILTWIQLVRSVRARLTADTNVQLSLF